MEKDESQAPLSNTFKQSESLTKNVFAASRRKSKKNDDAAALGEEPNESMRLSNSSQKRQVIMTNRVFPEPSTKQLQQQFKNQSIFSQLPM